jgi:hypothetical protein
VPLAPEARAGRRRWSVPARGTGRLLGAPASVSARKRERGSATRARRTAICNRLVRCRHAGGPEPDPAGGQPTALEHAGRGEPRQRARDGRPRDPGEVGDLARRRTRPLAHGGEDRLAVCAAACAAARRLGGAPAPGPTPVRAPFAGAARRSRVERRQCPLQMPADAGVRRGRATRAPVLRTPALINGPWWRPPEARGCCPNRPVVVRMSGWVARECVRRAPAQAKSGLGTRGYRPPSPPFLELGTTGARPSCLLVSRDGLGLGMHPLRRARRRTGPGGGSRPPRPRARPARWVPGSLPPGRAMPVAAQRARRTSRSRVSTSMTISPARALSTRRARRAGNCVARRPGRRQGSPTGGACLSRPFEPLDLLHRLRSVRRRIGNWPAPALQQGAVPDRDGARTPRAKRSFRLRRGRDRCLAPERTTPEGWIARNEHRRLSPFTTGGCSGGGGRGRRRGTRGRGWGTQLVQRAKPHGLTAIGRVSEGRPQPGCVARSQRCGILFGEP